MAKDLDIIAHSDRVEALFEPLKEMVGADFEPYRNHVYRVLTYATHFLGSRQERVAEVETALVYHDVGLWAAGDLAYLEPSIDLCLADNERLGWGHDPQILSDMIRWHHKVFPFTGPNAHEVNAVRRGDWIDASGGKVRMGVPRPQIARVEEAIPVLDFPKVLERLAGDLGGSKARGMGRVLTKVYKW